MTGRRRRHREARTPKDRRDQAHLRVTRPVTVTELRRSQESVIAHRMRVVLPRDGSIHHWLVLDRQRQDEPKSMRGVHRPDPLGSSHQRRDSSGQPDGCFAGRRASSGPCCGGAGSDKTRIDQDDRKGQEGQNGDAGANHADEFAARQGKSCRTDPGETDPTSSNYPLPGRG